MIDSPDRWDWGDLGSGRRAYYHSIYVVQTAMAAGQIIRDEHVVSAYQEELIDLTLTATASKVCPQYRTSRRTVHMRMNVALIKRGYANGDQLLKQSLITVGLVLAIYIDF